ncbi:MAG TPA: hypothetical protein VHF27_03210 [Acidimicrobiales bacterium]|nr:hypothetical protein [Acidimicrobiales bacterium]
MRTARRGLLALALLGLAGCGRAEGVSDTRRALEGAGFTAVDVGVRSGGGIDVVRVDAAGGDPARAAEVVWDTLPVRFDQLVVALGAGTSSYGYAALVERFGPRDPDLDRKQLSDQVVRDGLDLMLWLTLGALLSVGGVVALALLVVRTARRGRRPGGQADGPASDAGDDDASPTAGASATDAEGPEAIPS